MDDNRDKNHGGAAGSASRDAVIGTALSGRVPAGEKGCPPLEQIALLIDGALEGAERERILGHLASCANCREVFLTAQELAREPAQGGNSRRGWLVISSLAATAMLAVLAIRLAPGVWQPASAPTELARKQEPAPLVAETPAAPTRVARLSPPEVKVEPAARSVARAEQSREPLQLLSAEEAARPAAKSYGFVSAERSDGPVIAVDYPAQDGEESTVASLRIKFKPRQGEAVDLTTVKVECLKETPVDLTLRIKPYTTSDGIKVDKFKIPEGSYRFRVSVADYEGRLSEKEFSINVSGTF